jgi:hypothetical protein
MSRNKRLLALAVMEWWHAHKDDEEGGFKEPVYETEPEMVTLAKQILEEATK